MSSIDNRIVEMKFDNDQFESGVKTTLETLDNLKKGLDFSGIQNGIDALQKRFSTMGIVGMEVTRRLTNATIDAAKRFGSATLGQIKSGGMTRALNIEQARFQLRGLFSDMENVDEQVENVMDAALNAVKGTAYGLDEAAKSASVLAASGVGMSDMESVLTSIAGAAAMTGRSYEDIGNIYSTVASNGKLMTMQLRQFSAAGLNVAAVLTKYYKKSEEEINEMVTKGEVSFKDFSEAMKIFGSQAKRANETFSGSLSNMKAALSRIGAAFAGPYLENMRDIFNAITPAIDEVGEALKPFNKEVETAMKTVKKFIVEGLGALTGGKVGKGKKEHYVFKEIGLLTNSLVMALKSLLLVIKPVRSAFKEIFPNATIDNLKNIIKLFYEFVATIYVKLANQIDNFKDGWAGLFTVFKTLGNVIKFVINIIKAATAPFGGIINIIGTLIGTIGRAIQKFYNFASGSSFVVKGSQKIIEFVGKAAQALHDFFTNSKTLNVLHSIISGVAAGFSFLGKALTSVFNSIKDLKLFDKFVSGIQKIKDALSGISVGKGFSLDSLFSGMFSGLEGFSEKFKSFIDAIAKLDFGKILNTGLIAMVAGSILQLTKAIDMLIDRLVVGKDKGFRLASTLHAKLIDLGTWMDKKLDVENMKAKALVLLSMAAAMAVFGYTVKSLGKLDTESLIRGLVGVGVLFEMMSTSLSRLTSSLTTKSTKDLIKATVSLVLVSVAIRSLSKAVLKLSEVPLDELIKGLVGVGVLLAALSKFLTKTDFKGFGVTKGFGLMAVAVSMSIMAYAVKKFGDMNIKELAKGLVSVSVLLAAISGALRLAGNPKHMIAMGAGLVLMAASMIIFASAVKKMGSVNPDEIGQGLLSFTAVLAVLTATVKLMPGAKALAIGAALVVMSVGILAISGALKILSSISLEQMGVGLLGIAGSLLSLGLLSKLVNPVSLIAASAAIVIFAAGITLLTPALLAFGNLKLEQIGKALLMLVGVLTVFGLAALILTPVIPAMIALGVAIAVLGAGVTLTAAGLMLLATAFAALAVSAAAGAAALVAALTAVITGLITIVPKIGAALAEAFLSFIATLSENAAKLTDAAVKLGLALLKGIQQIVPQLIATGLTLILALLSGIEANIEMIATIGLSIIAKLILGIARGIGTIIQAGIALMMAFVNGLAQGIRDNTEMVVAAAKNMMSAVIEAILTLLQGLLGSIPVIGDEISAGLDTAKEKVRDFFDVEEAEKMSSDYINGVSKGINAGIAQVKASAEGAGEAVEKPTIAAFRQLDKVSEEGVGKVAKNIENGKEAVGASSTGLSEEVMAPMRQTLEEAGFTGEQIDNMLGKGMTDNLGAVQAGAENITNVSNKEYDKATQTAAKKAKEQTTAYSKALDPKTAANAAKSIAERVAKNLDAGRKTALGAGKSLVKEYSVGIKKDGRTAETAAKNMAQSSGRAANDNGAKLTVNTAGQELGNGFIKGINSKQQAAYDAGYKLGAKAAQGVKDGEKSSSPSKLGILAGKYLGEGLVIGINSMNDAAYESGYNMGKTASDALTKAASKINDVISSNIDDSPTITPVLDLSNVAKGVDQMNGMLDTRAVSASISGNMSRLGMAPMFTSPSNNSVANTTTNTFNITVDGTENPEAFADRLVRQFQLRGRMA